MIFFIKMMNEKRNKQSISTYVAITHHYLGCNKQSTPDATTNSSDRKRGSVLILVQVGFNRDNYLFLHRFHFFMNTFYCYSFPLF